MTEVKTGSLAVSIHKALDQQKVYGKAQLSRPVKNAKVSNLNQGNSFGRIVFIYGKNPEGKYILKFDSDLNGSLMDEQEHYISETQAVYNIKELENDTVSLPIQTIKNGKTLKRLIPFIFRVDKDERLFYSIALHGLANIYETDIEVHFKISTENQNLIPHLPITDKDSKASETIAEKNKLFRIKGNIFKFSDIDLFEESLYLSLIPLRRATSFQKPPNFSGREMTTGETISSHSYQGNFLYIDFWASWCKPCITEIPNLINVINELKHENIEFLGIANDTRKAAQKAIQKYSITWPQ